MSDLKCRIVIPAQAGIKATESPIDCRCTLSDMNRQYFVYILGSERPTLYIGITNNLSRRIWEHKTGVADSFTKKYKINKLLYFEIYDSAEEAIKREKIIKRWKREWKIRLIQKENPTLIDLTTKLTP